MKSSSSVFLLVPLLLAVAQAGDGGGGTSGSPAKPSPACSLKSNSTLVECDILVRGGSKKSPELLSAERVRRVKGLRLKCPLDEATTGANGRPLPPAVFLYLRDVLDDGLEIASAASGATWTFPDNSLEHLEIVDCPFRRLQRLDLLFIASSVTAGLKSLTIRNERLKQHLLAVEADAFQDAPRQLETVDLSSNGLAYLDSRLFCPVARTLTGLNLSHNSLESLDFVGGCSLEKLERLDVSFNGLKRLGRDTFRRTTPKLAEIDLSYNKLAAPEDGAFNGLGELAVANLAHNELSAIPANLFQDGSKLRELYLSNNSLTRLPDGFLERLSSNLVVLNLSHNAIASNSKWFEEGPFKALKALVALDLSFNRLARLGGDVFRGLSSLQVLTVAHNQIHSVSAEVFRPTPNLHALVLSHNAVEDFGESAAKSKEGSVFGGLDKLSSLALDHNKIKTLDRYRWPSWPQ